MEEVTFSIGKAARYLGKSPSYLRLLDTHNILKPSERTNGGHRRYTRSALDSFQSNVSKEGVCLYYRGIPDNDYPASLGEDLLQRGYQQLMGMGLLALEDATAPAFTKDFFSYLPDLLRQIDRADVTRLAISHVEIIPSEALATLCQCCAAVGIQVYFLNLS